MYGRKRTYASKSGALTKKSKKRRTLPKIKLLSTQPSRTGSYHCQLRYSETYALNPTVGGNAGYVLTSNGLFDPDFSGVGHQPAGFDQLMGLWNEYVVVASKIKVVLTNNDANSYTALWGISHQDFSTLNGDARVYIENGSTVWTKIDARGGGVSTLMNYANMRKFSTQDVFTENGYSGTATTNPTDTHYWHIFLQTDGAVDSGNFYASVEICYDVYFRDPSLTALS